MENKLENEVFETAENEVFETAVIEETSENQSKLGDVAIGIGIGAAVIGAGVALYKVAIKPGITWIRKKVCEKKQKDLIEAVEQNDFVDDDTNA